MYIYIWFLALLILIIQFDINNLFAYMLIFQVLLFYLSIIPI